MSGEGEREGSSMDGRPETLSYASPAARSVRWVTIDQFHNAVQAQLVESALLAKGFHTRLLNANVTSAYSLGFSAKLQVPEDEVDGAREVLREAERRAADRRSLQRCPACNVEGRKGPSRLRRRAGVVVVVLGIALCAFEDFAVGASLVVVGIGMMVFALSERVRCPKCDAVLPEPDEDDGGGKFVEHIADNGGNGDDDGQDEDDDVSDKPNDAGVGGRG